MLVCPFQGDQMANAERTAERRISKILNIHDELNFNQIKNFISEIIRDARWENDKLDLI